MLTGNSIQAITQGEWIVKLADPKVTIRGATFDTRQVIDQHIFFCWQGEQADGHNFVNKLAATSIKLIIAEKIIAVPDGIALLLVKNSLESLHKIAQWLASNFRGDIIALTASSGKTTTKNWLSAILANKFNVLQSQKNFNNHIGCPITMLDLQPHHNLIILEMGASSIGEIELLTKIINPSISILLNVGLAHLGMFGCLANTYKAKLEIFKNNRKNAVGFIPNDSTLKKMVKKLNSPKFKIFDTTTEIKCELLEANFEQFKMLFDITIGKITKKIWIPTFGVHLSSSISLICSVATHLDLSWEQIQTGLTKLPIIDSRMAPIKLNQNRYIIDDTYNANPDSVINLLNSMAIIKKLKKIAVIGELAELEEGLTHSANYIIQRLPNQIDKILFLGKTGKILVDAINRSNKPINCEFCANKKQALQKIQQYFTANTVIGIKGSRSSKMEQLVKTLQNNN